MTKKGENIFKRKDGRWEARYVIGYNLKGKLQYGYIYGTSYLDVKRKKNEKLIELMNLVDNEKTQSVESIINTFLKIKKLQVKESTYCRYKEIIRIYFLSYFKNKAIANINDELLINFYNEKLTKLNSKTQKDILVLLNQILKYGGVSTRAVYPKINKIETKTISHSEIISIENYTMNNINSITMSFIMSLYLGLRIGELCALKWSDIDLENKYINVTKTVNRIKNNDIYSNNKTKIVVTSPKSEKSTRLIPIPSFLNELIIKNKNDILENSYFLTNTNRIMEPRLLRYKFKKISKELNIDCKFHTLRHTFATRCIELGFDPKTLSEILGHSSVKTTLSLYVHPRDEFKVKCMEKLEFLSSQIDL